jgi:alpha-L-fucosidase
LDNLVTLYETSVGRNGKLLLNVPPTRDGRLHDVDVARLSAFRSRLDAMFAADAAHGASAAWRSTGARTAELEIRFEQLTPVGLARLEEPIARGQRVARYALYGALNGEWHELSRGTTIGYTKLDRFSPVSVSRVRLSIEDAVDTPERVEVRLYG